MSGSAIVGFVFLVAAIAKLADPGTFGRTLATWQIMPKWGAEAAGALVPMIELTLGIWLLSRVGPRIAARAGCIVLVLLTLAFVSEWAVNESPDCSCFGLLQAYAAKSGFLESVIARNAVMCALLLPAVVLRSQPAEEPCVEPSHS